MIPANPNGAKLAKLSLVPAEQADHDEQDQHPELDQHHHRVDGGRLAGPADQQQRAQPDQHDRREIDQPAALGRLDSRSGIRTPNRLSSSSLTYSDQPTATAADDTPYSSSRHAATAMATTSPSVA